MGNEIFRCGCCKPETKHIELNSNAIFTCFKSKTMLCLFFRNVEQRSILSFIFVKSYDRSLWWFCSKFLLINDVERITKLCQGRPYLLWLTFCSLVYYVIGKSHANCSQFFRECRCLNASYFAICYALVNAVPNKLFHWNV